MASIEEIRSRILATPTLTLVPARKPGGFGGLNFLRGSLRAQSVVLFVLLVAFVASAELITQNALQAGNTAQAEQVGLITWRYDTVRASLAAEELRTNLAQMNNSQLGGDAGGAQAYQSLAEADIAAIDSKLAEIAGLKLPKDEEVKIAQDALAFNTLTTFARHFIAAGRHTNQEMLTQVDGAISDWRYGRTPDDYIQAELKTNQVVIDAGKATSSNVQLFAAILTILFLATFAFYEFYL